MNIKITHSWLLEFLDTDATAEEIQKYLSLSGPSVERIEKIKDDFVYDIEITSNRIDSASVTGIAREAAAILPRFAKKAVFKKPNLDKPAYKKNTLSLNISDKEKLTNRIMAVIIDGVHFGESPAYIKTRLESVGIRSLNNLVDITNYVMIEIGHPTHVFDYDRIKTGNFFFRTAKKGEKLITLDKKSFDLQGGEVIIDDGSGRIIDLPSIMGTENSVVTSDTKRVIFFIDNVDPVLIRKASMKHGIRTLAAAYNEKNPDPELGKQALLRGIQLFINHAKPDSISEIIDIYSKPVKPVQISLTPDLINSRIGIKIREEEIISILKNLEFKVSIKNGILQIVPPSYRSFDIQIPEDIVEEVARIFGYFKLPSVVQPTIYIKQPKEIELLFNLQTRIKHYLKDIGLHEVMNYSMISKEMIENFNHNITEYMKLSNTISEDIEYMRRYLTSSLLTNIKDNEGKKKELKLFEIAKTYKPITNNLPEEKYHLAIVVNTGLYDLKGIIYALLIELNITGYSLKKCMHRIFYKNEQGEIIKNEQILGKFGKINQEIKNKFKIESDIYEVDFDLETLVKFIKPFKQFKPINPYAVIKLDKTFTINPNYTYEVIYKAAYQSKLLQKLEVISLFKNKLTLRFYYSSTLRNITEEEAKKELGKIKESVSVKK